METVTGALRFSKHILIGNIKKKMFGEALAKTICCALNMFFLTLYELFSVYVILF